MPLSEGRTSLVATLRAADAEAPCLAFTGHFDTVPLGTARWSVDPFGAQIDGDRLYGRGASDMKSGVAAAVAAALNCADWLGGTAGVALILTAGEETGCDGARELVRSAALPQRVGALVVGEPTSNRPRLGHKGALWFHACTHGRTAHASMPELGDNAILKMARLVLDLEAWQAQPDRPGTARPTLNVGTIEGGLNINSVPDRASIGIDMRTPPGLSHEALTTALATRIGGRASLRRLLDAPGVHTDEGHPWVREVLDLAAADEDRPSHPALVPYFTDASVLKPALGDVPTVILGPGEPQMAHQTDEYVHVSRIREATARYEALIRRWCGRAQHGNASPP